MHFFAWSKSPVSSGAFWSHVISLAFPSFFSYSNALSLPPTPTFLVPNTLISWTIFCGHAPIALQVILFVFSERKPSLPLEADGFRVVSNFVLMHHSLLTVPFFPQQLKYRVLLSRLHPCRCRLSSPLNLCSAFVRRTGSFPLFEGVRLIRNNSLVVPPHGQRTMVPSLNYSVSRTSLLWNSLFFRQARFFPDEFTVRHFREPREQVGSDRPPPDLSSSLHFLIDQSSSYNRNSVYALAKNI